MRVLHLPSSFFPENTGGKEVFVFELVKNMPQAEHRVLLHRGEMPESYLYRNVRVDVLPSTDAKNSVLAYYTWIYDDLKGFDEYLNEYKPHIVHFHDQGEGASLSHLRICKDKNIKTILTYHSPGQSCLQRALLYEGKTPCDGTILIDRCTYCRYKIRGISNSVARIASLLDLPIDTSGRIILRHSTAHYFNSWLEFNKSIDKIQVHAMWVKDMLLRNNISEQKIHYLPLGGHSSLPLSERRNIKKNEVVRLVFVGRCSDSKGIHILIKAIQLLPRSCNVEVYFFGPYWQSTEYGREMTKKISGDERFKSPVLLPPSQVINELKNMDLCIIPSLWPETGPFTVLDAFAAGVPVIGTNLAGISERVEDGRTGLLFKWNDSEDLSEKIKYLIEDKARIDFLKSNILENHTFEEMSLKFYDLYNTL